MLGRPKDISVSGEVRLLDENGETRRLLLALERLVASVSLEHFALIGGLAVMARLGQAHRGTQDIDTAVDQEAAIPSELDVVADAVAPAEQERAGRRVKVDSIEVGGTPAVDLNPEDLPEEEFPRAFVLAHRWAFDTASELTLRCNQRQGPDTIVTCRVATSAALVAMKLQSAPRRPPARVQKAANDYLDLTLLLSNLVLLPQIIAGLAESPHGLGAWCAERIRNDFVDNAARISSKIHQSPTSRRVTPDELSQIGRRFIEMFTPPG
jgi:hypothetical protein